MQDTPNADNTQEDVAISEEFTPGTKGRGPLSVVKLAVVAVGVGAAGFVYANQDMYTTAYANFFQTGEFGPTCASTKGNFAGGGCGGSGMTAGISGSCSGGAMSGCSAGMTVAESGGCCSGMAGESETVTVAEDVAPFLAMPTLL